LLELSVPFNDNMLIGDEDGGPNPEVQFSDRTYIVLLGRDTSQASSNPYFTSVLHGYRCRTSPSCVGRPPQLCPMRILISRHSPAITVRSSCYCVIVPAGHAERLDGITGRSYSSLPAEYRKPSLYSTVVRKYSSYRWLCHVSESVRESSQSSRGLRFVPTPLEKWVAGFRYGTVIR
jgi:hypothetical protein